VGSGDPTIWLEDNNGEYSPLIIPLWSADFPKSLAVYMTESGEIGVALTRKAMLRTCRKLLEEENTLWFCNIPLERFLEVTDADPQLFQR
jgi:hypothetical protein